MTYLERAHLECMRIRNRHYAVEEWAKPRFKQRVLDMASTERRILDVGCGRESRFLRSVAHAFGRCFGVDPEVDDRREGNLQLMRGGGEAIPLRDDCVEVITMVNVVEHLMRPAEVFCECRRVLRSGGSLFVLGPSKWFLPTVVGRLFPHAARQHLARLLYTRDIDDTFRAYYRANTVKDLGRLARRAGLVLARSEYLSDHPWYLEFSPLLYRCWCALERGRMRRNAFARLLPCIFARLDKPSRGQPVDGVATLAFEDGLQEKQRQALSDDL